MVLPQMRKLLLVALATVIVVFVSYFIVFSTFLPVANSLSSRQALSPPYPLSTEITSIAFDQSTLRTEAPGSDNWAVTWADNGHQYTSWGDGGGFKGDNRDGRVSLGFARVEGDKDSYTGHNVWGGKNTENPAQFGGKSYGIISLDGVLYMWRCGARSNKSAFDYQELYKSTDHSATWEFTGVKFDPDIFPENDEGFFCPTFLQFGQDYQGARDNFVYSYAPEISDSERWEIQKPGKIALFRVLKSQIADQSQYEFLAGLDGAGSPTWSSDPTERKPVFEDAVNGVMRTSVSYNAGLGRYLLITQQVARLPGDEAHIGIYDAPEPWGPWTTVLFDLSTIIYRGKTVYWNFSNKWLSPDGHDFVLILSDGDKWGTIEGRFNALAK